jgi:hypothetical protein
MFFRDLQKNRTIEVYLKKDLAERLNSLRGHKESERFAKDIWEKTTEELFDVK